MGGRKMMGMMTMTMMIMIISAQNYGDALKKSILFFEGQRSGKLPSSQRLTWRKDSGLNDGKDVQMDLTGGYYDAGDNVKFNFPLAFTVTLLAWSVIDLGKFMGPDHAHALDAIRWGTDYLLKSTSIPGTVFALVGDPVGDHMCWQRPEDMDTPRTAYQVNTTHPGSDVSAEIAAALASASLAFKPFDSTYSQTLINRAESVFDFADKHRGSYSDPLNQVLVCPFYYCSSDYMDELSWGAAWLHRATNKKYYWDYVYKMSTDPSLTYRYNFAEFGWDTKVAGINVLVSEWVLANKLDPSPFVPDTDRFICSLLPESPTKTARYSPGGLLFKNGASNHAGTMSFLLLIYARISKHNKRTIQCGDVVVSPERLIDLARGQVNYLLGDNPLGLSYLLGYGNKYPQRIHHRASSLPSLDEHPGHIDCQGGSSYYSTTNPNQNLLTGAVVGPTIDDSYVDNRDNVSFSEPTTYITAPLVGLLAYFKGSS